MTRLHYSGYVWDAVNLRPTSRGVWVPGVGVRETIHQPLVLGGSEDRALKTGLFLIVAAGVALIVMGARDGAKRKNPKPRRTAWSHYNEFFDKPDWRVGYLRQSTGKRVYRSGLTEGGARKVMRELEKKFPECDPIMEPHPRARKDRP